MIQNKKTGEIGKLIYLNFEIDISEIDLTIMLDNSDGECIDRQFYSLDELKKYLNEWEEYKPKEPLIKDEKIRKAVRAWWETIPDAVTDKRVLYKNNHDFAVGIYSIYCGEIYPETLEVGKMYTITELCGEEEE